MSGTRLEETKGCRVSIASGVDGQLVVVKGVVARWIFGEGSGGAVFKALINRQHHQLSGSGQLSAFQHPAQVPENAGALRAIPAQNFLDSVSHAAEPPLPALDGPRDEKVYPIFGSFHPLGRLSVAGGHLLDVRGLGRDVGFRPEVTRPEVGWHWANTTGWTGVAR